MTVEQPPDAVDPSMRLRASDADREKVAEVLRDAYTEGRLTPVELDERLAEAFRATTYADLAPVLRELPVPPGTLAMPTAAMPMPMPMPVPGTAPVRPELATAADRSLVAVFSGFQRRGAWTVPPELSAVCIFGGGELDLTEAVLTSGQTVITATCIFGGLEITVPAGMVVRSEVVGIFGGTEVPPAVADPAAPVLVLKGAAIFGGIEVKRPKLPKR